VVPTVQEAALLAYLHLLALLYDLLRNRLPLQRFDLGVAHFAQKLALVLLWQQDAAAILHQEVRLRGNLIRVANLAYGLQSL
jgi:hypothetical protein